MALRNLSQREEEEKHRREKEWQTKSPEVKVKAELDIWERRFTRDSGHPPTDDEVGTKRQELIEKYSDPDAKYIPEHLQKQS